MQEEFQQIADVIKQHREAQGITQEQLAERAGISVSHLSKIEAKIRNTGMQTYLKLMKALEIPEEQQFPHLYASAEKNAQQEKLWGLMQDCSEKEFKILLRSLEVIKKKLRGK